MTKREQIFTILKDNKLLSTSAIEKKAGMTKYKLHAFLHKRTDITNEEADSVLTIIKNANKFQR